MYLRCSQCHEPTWLRSLVPGLVEHTVQCQDCGHEHDLTRSSELGETGKEQYTNANEFSRRNSVDLPTAYSVLLGLMTLQEAREQDSARREKNRKETTAAAAPPPPDEDFFPVAKPERRKKPRPSPTPIKKRTRPEKNSQATILVERETAGPARALTRGQLALLSVLAVLLIGMSGRYAYRSWRGMAEEGRAARANSIASAKAQASADEKAQVEARATQTEVPAALVAEVRRDESGRVVEVVGPNPMAVLQAYCEASTGSFEKEPLELAQATPANPRERFGIFRDFSRLETNLAIRISLDRKSQRWIAGNGRGPIQTREAPEFPDTITRVTANSAR